MTRRWHQEVNNAMKRICLIGCIMTLVSPVAYSQSDEEILEIVQANATKIFIEQASVTLPESFHNSGLADVDKETLIQQWANASGACLSNALAEYATTTDVPLSDMVADDGSFSLEGDGSSTDFNLNMDTCLERAWESIGASLP